MPVSDTRIAIIGCGHVGTSCAFAILQRHLAREIVLIDENPTHAQGEALDLQQSVPLGTPVKVTAGDYKDAAASAVVIFTAGAPGGFTGSRFDTMAANAGILRSSMGKLRAEGFEGVLVIATNPVDVLTYLAQKESGLPPGRVIGSDTLLDSERLRDIVGEQLEVDPRSVHAFVIGEHGDSSVAVWSSAQVAGLPLRSFPGVNALSPPDDLLTAVRHAGPVVASLKGNTCFAVAACVTRICEAVLRDERSVLAVSTLIEGQYGLRDVALSTPCVVGRNGIETAIELRLDAGEQAALERSAGVLKDAIAKVPSP
jgi:L-lactate dehydrogenase